VGAHYKSPLLPIWVVCSESHYSVLFSPAQALVLDAHPPAAFDLLYVDGLQHAWLHEAVRLTVRRATLALTACEKGACARGKACGCAIPPLDLVIRTKWKGMLVDWNGVEPFL
jgi:hypothetical protein